MDEVYEMAETEAVVEEQIYQSPYEPLKSEESVPATLKFVPPSVVPNFIATSAATGINDDDMHKFIRTAQMKFKVKDVVEATHLIESIILNNKGFIINTSISNKELNSQTINISKDSALMTYYTNLESRLQLKVPCQLLDTTLRQIAPLAVLIDYRIVDAKDVTVQLMKDNLDKIRMEKKQKRLSAAIDTKGRKLDDITEAEHALDYALEQADKAKLSEFTTNEQIAFSTISINLYQDVMEHKEKVLRQKELKTYEPGFGSKIADAFVGGWYILSAILIFLINIWPVLLIIVVIVIVYFRIKKRNVE